jgi:hypothetical protein
MPWGFGWARAEDPLHRTSHERVRALGEPEAVLVLLDRHRRDADTFGSRLGVPVLETPFAGLPGSPFEVRPVRRGRFWREVALWWPATRTLVCADALGTLGYFRGGEGPLGVHPALRLNPPRRALAGLEPEHVLVGHGEGVHGPQAAQALDRALARARRGIPASLRWGAGSLIRRRQGEEPPIR